MPLLRSSSRGPLGPRAAAISTASLVLVAASGASAETYQVGPDKPYTDLYELQEILVAGDVVEVDGGQTYGGELQFEGTGTPSEPIVIRGIRVGGQRPIIEGGTNTVILYANHIVFEGFEVTGGEGTCIVHKGDDVTIRDVLVRDCPNHGILGTDFESGSLLMEYVEVARSGQGDYKHSVYIATDELMYPGSVFRMQHCFIHDANGGHSVKSRSERNEIYYNWIEGAMFHELDLVGPEEYETDVAREDSDIVGNVLVKTNGQYTIARMGGDGTGETFGRYRFVNNTMILNSETSYALRLQDGADTLELHNNVVAGGGADTTLWRDEVGASIVAGSNNWIQSGIQIPADVIGAIVGDDPGFESLADFDLRPREGSPLIDAGAPNPASPAGHEFPSPLGVPAFVPAPKAIYPAGMAAARNEVGPLDLGAYEFGSPVDPGNPGSGGAGSGGSGSGNGSGTGNSGNPFAPGGLDDGGGEGGDDGCGCRTAGAPSEPVGWLALAALGWAIVRRRGSRG